MNRKLLIITLSLSTNLYAADEISVVNTSEHNALGFSYSVCVSSSARMHRPPPFCTQPARIFIQASSLGNNDTYFTLKDLTVPNVPPHGPGYYDTYSVKIENIKQYDSAGNTLLTSSDLSIGIGGHKAVIFSQPIGAPFLTSQLVNY